MNRLFLILGSVVIIIVLGYFWKTSSLPSPSTPNVSPSSAELLKEESKKPLPPLQFVGAKTCVPCHAEESELWKNSHHELAMQEANETTVLGNFDNTTFKNFGVTSRFYRKGKAFLIQTDGPDGSLQEYEVTHTFGVTPLQQYLIKFPGGRYQALGIAWDDRPQKEGGQRWFHLYPNEKIAHDDELHWTGPNQNWNYMCAECHSTNLRKNYNRETDRYNTTWSDIQVACEACHGPGSRHVAWVNNRETKNAYQSDDTKGLAVHLPSYDANTWQFSAQGPTARLQTPRMQGSEIEMCARCHSRRRAIKETYSPGKPLLDTHLPALLEPGLYHHDGQIQDEVYVYGSFLQSKMYHAGVACRDCHEPHDLQLRGKGNALCTRCHRKEHFDSDTHHFHQTRSTGSQCVNCHMPAKNYMVIDPRRDHSIRIPRPDLSIKLGTPNACNQCHDDKKAQWAADALRGWGKPVESGQLHYGEILTNGYEGKQGAEIDLMKVAQEDHVPGIVRGTALSILRNYPNRATMTAVGMGMKDKDPLVRIGAIRALEALPPNQRFSLGVHLLNDPIRAVRTEAGRSLAAVPPTMLSPVQREQLKQALDEYVQSQMVNAERPSSFLNLGIVHAERGELNKAEEAYQTALKLESTFYPALVNLADVYRVQKRDDKGELTLRKALSLAPNDASVHHALGLLLIRTKRTGEAMTALKKAWEIQPEHPRYGYVYGIALQSTGKPQQAITVLEEAHRQHQTDRQILMALITLNRDSGNDKAVQKFTEKFQALSPPDKTRTQTP